MSMTEQNLTDEQLYKAFGVDNTAILAPSEEQIAKRDDLVTKLAERLGVHEGGSLALDLRLANGDFYSVFDMMHALLDRMDKF